MATKSESKEDDSFIILGTSPGTSLDVKISDVNGAVSVDKSHIEDALKGLSMEASGAYKAQFELGDCPSPASMMIASNLVIDDASTEELQKRFGKILDENVILKESLKQNNESIKDQFVMIMSFQEDMIKTHQLHKEKFDETKELIEKLRQENKQLKQELAQRDAEKSSGKSGPSSGLEFVTSPEDDTIHKLTAQLELVERQRREIWVDNEKLTWQKESLEHIVDITSNECAELKIKVRELQLLLSDKETELSGKIQEMESKVLLSSAMPVSNVSPEEIANRDAIIKQLDGKVSNLQGELKAAQLKIMNLENVKLEFAKHKSSTSGTVRMYKEQLQELHHRLKEAHTTVFQPVRVSLGGEEENLASSEYGSFVSNVKLYDRTLKHLAELLNTIMEGLSDSLMEALGVTASLQDMQLDKSVAGPIHACLQDLRHHLEKQHSQSLTHAAQVRGTMSIFEGIFKEYCELLKKSLTKSDIKPPTQSVEALTSALLARGEEIKCLQEKIKTLCDDKDDKDLLKAQIDLYKSDFEAERESRQKMASEKESILVDCRTLQSKVDDLTEQLDTVRRLNPEVYNDAKAQRIRRDYNPTPASPARTGDAAGITRPASNGAIKKKIYTCPKCMKFRSDSCEMIAEHLDYCSDIDENACSNF